MRLLKRISAKVFKIIKTGNDKAVENVVCSTADFFEHYRRHVGRKERKSSTMHIGIKNYDELVGNIDVLKCVRYKVTTKEGLYDYH